jgi:cytochrome c5
MNSILGRAAMWFFMTAAVAVVAFAAAQDLPEDEGKKLVEDSCGSCHSLDPVVQLKLDQAGWQEMVAKMAGYGAQLDEMQTATVVAYLAKHFGTGDAAVPAPAASDEEAKKLVDGVCASCHDADLVRSTQATKEGWDDIVKNMNAKGIGMSDADVSLLVEYLAKTYPAK